MTQYFGSAPRISVLDELGDDRRWLDLFAGDRPDFDLAAAAPPAPVTVGIDLARGAGFTSISDMGRAYTVNMSPEEIADRDRVPTRQERRQAARLARKGRGSDGGI